jgi:hypothetical protein
LLSRAARGEKSGDGGVTWRADNAGEMCTGIIFPGKCAVIEKKNERRGRRRGSVCSESFGLYFVGMRAAGSRDGKERRAHRAIQLDAVGRE